MGDVLCRDQVSVILAHIMIKVVDSIVKYLNVLPFHNFVVNTLKVTLKVKRKSTMYSNDSKRSSWHSKQSRARSDCMLISVRTRTYLSLCLQTEMMIFLSETLHDRSNTCMYEG